MFAKFHREINEQFCLTMVSQLELAEYIFHFDVEVSLNGHRRFACNYKIRKNILVMQIYELNNGILEPVIRHLLQTNSFINF